MKLPKCKVSEADKRHALYNTWWNMLARCYLPIAPGFSNYGGRGICVCDEWLTFKNFSRDMGENKPHGYTLERSDSEADYSPENCKWASRSDQMLNRRQFGNNSTGATGVVRIGARFEARFHWEGVRYRIGMFGSATEAKNARADFIVRFSENAKLAIASIGHPTLWATSSTKVRGVSAHKDGGFIVRVTKNGVRHYVGYFRNFDEACNARREFDQSGN